MKLVVISPEAYEPREHAVMAGLFAAGLERYHLRKPGWDDAAVHRFVQTVPEQWRSRLVLHQYHELAEELGCGGVHFKGAEVVLNAARPAVAPSLFTSCSCHGLAVLGKSVRHFDAAFFSPVFSSISKAGYQPSEDLCAVSAFLDQRTADERRTVVIALGGITPANTPRCAELGFDGVAVLGDLWQAPDPLKVFGQLQQSVAAHAS